MGRVGRPKGSTQPKSPVSHPTRPRGRPKGSGALQMSPEQMLAAINDHDTPIPRPRRRHQSGGKAKSPATVGLAAVSDNGTPTPRPRVRPKGSGKKQLSPAEMLAAINDHDTPIPRPRGRPKGSGKKTIPAAEILAASDDDETPVPSPCSRPQVNSRDERDSMDDDDDDEEEDEETLKLQLAAIQAKLKLKRLRAKAAGKGLAHGSDHGEQICAAATANEVTAMHSNSPSKAQSPADHPIAGRTYKLTSDDLDIKYDNKYAGSYLQIDSTEKTDPSAKSVRGVYSPVTPQILSATFRLANIKGVMLLFDDEWELSGFRYNERVEVHHPFYREEKAEQDYLDSLCLSEEEREREEDEETKRIRAEREEARIKRIDPKKLYFVWRGRKLTTAKKELVYGGAQMIGEIRFTEDFESFEASIRGLSYIGEVSTFHGAHCSSWDSQVNNDGWGPRKKNETWADLSERRWPWDDLED